MGNTSSEKLDEAKDKLLSGDRSKEAALNLLTLENADKRSDFLLDRFVRDPSLLSSADKQELQTYLQVYAYEMSREYGSDMAQELVKGLLSGNDYVKRSPDNELQRKAQSILAGWSTQESQAAVGTPTLLALSGPIGATLRAATAAGGAYQFGTGVGQLIEGDDTWAAAGNMASGALAMSAVGLKPGSTGSAGKGTRGDKLPNGSVSSGISGMLAPGRTVQQNVGIAVGGAVFTDGPDMGSVGGAALGAWAGGKFGGLAPGAVGKITGANHIPEFIYDVIGAGGSEVVGGFTKDIIKASQESKLNSKDTKND